MAKVIGIGSSSAGYTTAIYPGSKPGKEHEVTVMSNCDRVIKVFLIARSGPLGKHQERVGGDLQHFRSISADITNLRMQSAGKRCLRCTKHLGYFYKVCQRSL